MKANLGFVRWISLLVWPAQRLHAAYSPNSSSFWDLISWGCKLAKVQRLLFPHACFFLKNAFSGLFYLPFHSHFSPWPFHLSEVMSNLPKGVWRVHLTSINTCQENQLQRNTESTREACEETWGLYYFGSQRSLPSKTICKAVEDEPPFTNASFETAPNWSKYIEHMKLRCF